MQVFADNPLVKCDLVKKALEKAYLNQAKKIFPETNIDNPTKEGGEISEQQQQTKV